ncbi:nitroreductase [Hellea sp.]|nr:nitroreductase [Hellea sp.]MDA8887737.1 nitroreductase [Hellea sp.]MDB4844937.1 nitroreductase [Hellea sp.]MDC0421380.1 nitroreductase [Hellea sp.]MDC1061410.1 nitroreductase [Hellea sp.]MDC1089558.1 nitroreductase [Hellea sp.]
MNNIKVKLRSPKSDESITNFLRTRRSNLVRLMSTPGPSKQELSEFLHIASRVPDHRKLNPWRFIVFEGESRRKFGEHLKQAYLKANKNASPDRVIFEKEKFLRAPLVIAVISSPKICSRGTPQREQLITSGLVCYNLCLAAQAGGYGAQWLTEWCAYDANVFSAMGLDASEAISGFVYIGTVNEPPQERLRPNVDSLILNWT